MTMSEPIADGVPVLPRLPEPDERLDAETTAAQAVDLDAAASPEPPLPVAGRHSPGAGSTAPRSGERVREADAASRSVLDHPATLVALSLLALVALVVGIDQASQGTWIALVPAVLLIVGYVAVVRRRRR